MSKQTEGILVLGDDLVDAATGEIVVSAEPLSRIPTATLVRRIVSRLPDGRIQLKHLGRMVTPAVGATWRLPTLAGTIDLGRSFTGVVIGQSKNRAFWPEALGQGSPAPACWSPDGLRGVGVPGGECHSCQFAQWGSSKQEGSRGQACNEYRSLLVYPVDERVKMTMLPTVVRISPASIDAWDRYVVMLGANGLTVDAVLTAFDLEDTSSRQGVTYTGVVFGSAGNLSDEEAYLSDHLWQTMARAIGHQEIAQEVEADSTTPEPLPAAAYGIDA